MEKKKKIIILSSIIIILLGVIIFNNINSKTETLKKGGTLIAVQENLEKDFDIDGFTFDNPNIILDPYEISPLTALIIFETEEEVTPKITIKGKDSHTTYEETFEKGTEHYLPVLGLYADTNNEIILEIEDEEISLFIQTDKLPENFAIPEYIYSDKTELDDELYYFTPASDGYISAYDINGDVRWYLTIESTWKIEKLENGNMLIGTERLINAPYYNTGLYEIDMLGKIHKEYSLEGGYHHDYALLDNGNLIVLSDDFEGGTVEDVIVEVDHETGEIVKEIDLKDILNQEDSKSENWVSYDWFHNNSIWYDKASNTITLSGRHQDAVINVDYETGKLNWIIGDPTNWSDEYQKYFFEPIGNDFEWQWSQHAAMITPEGYVFILDNGNNKSKIEEEYVPASESYTRGVMYKIDTDDMTIEQVWEYGKERGSEFYSPYVSDVDYIDKDHYIVHSGGIVYVDGEVSNSPAGLTDADKLVTTAVELLDDEIIFEIQLPTNTYRVEKMDLYDNYEFNLNKAVSVGSIGPTTVDNEEDNYNMWAKNINDYYEEKQIEITQEIDRLSISGKFDKTDDVSIILYQDKVMKEYNVRISQRPYTALCVDIFEGADGVAVYKYINEENLNGEYEIYIKINDDIYRTKKVVNFN